MTWLLVLPPAFRLGQYPEEVCDLGHTPRVTLVTLLVVAFADRRRLDEKARLQGRARVPGAGSLFQARGGVARGVLEHLMGEGEGNLEEKFPSP